MEENTKDNMAECRNCKSSIKNKIKRCQYCGIVNPTVKIPEILKTMAVVIILMMIYTLFFN